MSDLAVGLYTNVEASVFNAASSLRRLRQDHAVAVIIVAVAVIVALGVLTAWFVYCAKQGKYPALDMPGIQQGGTWKLYCKK